MITSSSDVVEILLEAEREVGRYSWEGTFADYLKMVSEKPSVSRLSHKVVYDAIMDLGVEESASGTSVYGIFEDKIFGLDDALERIVHYFSSSARRLEIRKRILLLLGPPASGKSSIAALIKSGLESHTRTDYGAVYAIKGCPMQEEPLHLIPHSLREKILKDHDIYIEGDLCPRCRYLLRTQYDDKPADVPVVRVVYSEQEAVGIGYYVATNPNPSGAALLVGSIDSDQLTGDRLEVAGKAFRLDGEFNVANRGFMEFVEIFKADRHLLTALLGLSQEQLIKMERFGSVYADEVVLAHSNDGDFQTFLADPHSEALRDRIIAIQIPYNRRVGDEFKIYSMMLKSSGLEEVHLSPLTLPTMSVFAVLSRLESPTKTAVTMLEKMRAYDGQMVRSMSQEDVAQEKRHYPGEGMTGISPRYVMNRLSSVASVPDICCVSPLKALDSLWHGLGENITLDQEGIIKYISLVKDTVEDYGERAITEVQRAFEERFEHTASELLSDYLANLATLFTNETVRDPATGTLRVPNDRDMREMEKHIGISDRERPKFRWDIFQIFTNLKRRNLAYNYTTEHRMKAAIEARLFPDRRTLEQTLSPPRSAKNQVEWARRRGAIHNRLIQTYGYCAQCAEDTIEYVIHVLKNKNVLRTPRNEGVEWHWNLDPKLPTTSEASEGPEPGKSDGNNQANSTS